MCARYIITELGSNGEFFDYINVDEPLRECHARYYFGQLLAAIDHCHSNGIAHRDIKLENFILDEEFNLKLMDFGMSVQNQDKSSMQSMPVGTPTYIPPEMLQYKSYKPFKCDLFSAGVCLFMMITGRNPYRQADQEKCNLFKAL